MTQLEILAVLTALVALAHWLGQKRGLRALGGALLVILLAGLAANLGVIPLASEGVAVYDHLLGTAAPVSIFLLLLNARLRSLADAGLPMLALFAFAAVGTVAGVLVAGWVLGAPGWMGEWYGPLSGMFAATYIGGGANFNALALHYGVMETGNLYAASAVADHVMTVVWIALLLALPQWMGWFLGSSRGEEPVSGEGLEEAGRATGRRPGLQDLAMLLALGLVAFVLSEELAARLAAWTGIRVPSILILTTLAVVLAQFEAVARLRGTQLLGMYGAYLFLAALAAYCEVAALRELGWIGIQLLLFVVILIAVHGTVVILAGRAMRRSAEMVAVAPVATVGGSTVVLPLVERFRRQDLLLPGIILGTLGNLLGTYIGFTLVYLLPA